MACLLLIVVVAFPRIALVLLFFFSHYLERAYHGLLIPLIGFLFLPLTTLAYAWMVNAGMPTAGVNLLILLVAVIIDIGGWEAENITAGGGDGRADPFSMPGKARFVRNAAHGLARRSASTGNV